MTTSAASPRIVVCGGLAFEVPSTAYEPQEALLPVAQLAASVVQDGDIVLDIGCGVGTQGLYVAKQHSKVMVLGVDKHMPSVIAARNNAARMGVRAIYYHGHVFRPLPETKAAVAIITLPYEPASRYEGQDVDGQEHAFIDDQAQYAEALVRAHDYATYVAVLGEWNFERPYELAGWQTKRKVEGIDGGWHYLLEETGG